MVVGSAPPKVQDQFFCFLCVRLFVEHYRVSVWTSSRQADSSPSVTRPTTVASSANFIMALECRCVCMVSRVEGSARSPEGSRC